MRRVAGGGLTSPENPKTTGKQKHGLTAAREKKSATTSALAALYHAYNIRKEKAYPKEVENRW